MRLYRLARRLFVEGPGGAFSGEGAYLAGSRWNSPGHRMAFTSTSESLATLEYLVHASSEAHFEDVVLVIAELHERYIQPLDAATLAEDWRAFPPGVETVRLGDAWLASMRSVGVRVPSAIVPRESNVLINPSHKDASQLRVLAIEAWQADSRLL